jgi:hypothetical protein
MKNLANLLRRADITPRDRILTVVQNGVHKEKDGKGILTESEIHSLTDGWKPKTSQEAREYNKYLELSKLESMMRLDAHMLASRAENLLLRSHLIIEHVKNKFVNSGNSEDNFLFKHVSKKDARNFAIQNTYLDYKTLLHTLTYNNLPKEIQDDLSMLDEYVAHDKKYLEDEVFLYELFGNSKKLTPQNKQILIDRIFSCIYHDGFSKLKSGTEKDGLLLLHFFAELPMDAVIQKWAEYTHIDFSEKDNDELLNVLEQYAQDKNKTMEAIIKETISRWLDGSLFLLEYTPLFFSNNHNTWNGDTKLTHKEIFNRWYEELQKTKAYIDQLVSEGSLIIDNIDRELCGQMEKVKMITGESLYRSTLDIDFVNDYKKQVSYLLPLTGLRLFIERYNKPLENLETLKSFRELSEKFSDIFEIDMSEKYEEFVASLDQEIMLLNHSISMALDNLSGLLCARKDKKYCIDIKEDDFTLKADGGSEKATDDIVERYKKEIIAIFPNISL